MEQLAELCQQLAPTLTQVFACRASDREKKIERGERQTTVNLQRLYKSQHALQYRPPNSTVRCAICIQLYR
eukprot:COSAG05_NODE_287_length_12131_cov_3.148022_15_plen_71_part_00